MRCGAENFRPRSRRRRAAVQRDADRKATSRAPPARAAGSREIEIPSAFCEFSRLCEAENFPSGRNPDPRFRAAGVRPWPENGDFSDRRIPDARSHRVDASARQRAGLVAATECFRRSCAGSATRDVKRVNLKP
jgi:hypothetical protein